METKVNRMNYEEFQQKECIKWENKRREITENSNKAYNVGLLKGLGFRKAYLFPLFAKPTSLGRICLH